MCVSTMTSSELAVDSEDRVFPCLDNEVTQFFKCVADAERACALYFPAKGLTMSSANSARSHFTSFCNFLFTGLEKNKQTNKNKHTHKKTVRHDDAPSKNFVRRNKILCVIYAQMCVTGNTVTVQISSARLPFFRKLHYPSH